MKTHRLRTITLSFITLPLLLTSALAQKQTTILGDAWTGKVVAVDESKREITIEYLGKPQPGRLTAILPEGYKAGASQERLY